ncbi:Uncharacterized protein Rs2_38573 [Raphanus sativus]|nr:Uncharacterized protein Rs2_38573 [Raphanus sativus]
MYGRPRNLQGHVIPISSSHIRDISQRASLREPSFICLPEHRERLTTPIPSDPVSYSKEEVDEKLNEIYTIQYDSMNDFKCKLDSVYHPLNDKITGLTKTLKQLLDKVIIILERQKRENPARISMPSTSTADKWIRSTNLGLPKIDRW